MKDEGTFALQLARDDNGRIIKSSGEAMILTDPNHIDQPYMGAETKRANRAGPKFQEGEKGKPGSKLHLLDPDSTDPIVIKKLKRQQADLRYNLKKAIIKEDVRAAAVGEVDRVHAGFMR